MLEGNVSKNNLTSLGRWWERPLSRLACGMIQGYRLILSPYLGRACRFEPTCSQYTEEAIRRHGLVRGLVWGMWRILRCNPWGGSGSDPVPPCCKR